MLPRMFCSIQAYDQASVKMLLDTRKHLARGKDTGEAEAVIQASQRSASMVLVDDPLGRDWAQRHTLECHGTIWLCRGLRRGGFLRKLQPAYVRMLRRGRRQPLNEMNHSPSGIRRTADYGPGISRTYGTLEVLNQAPY